MQSLPPAKRTHRDAAVRQQPHQQLHSRFILGGEGWRHAHLADAEAFHQRRQTVEVIQVGVRQEYFIEAGDAARPEKRCDLPCRHFRTEERPGVIKERPPIGSFDDGTAPVADGQKRAPKVPLLIVQRWENQWNRQPRQTDKCRQRRESAKALHKQHRQESDIENRRPPARHVGHVPVSCGEPIGPFDQSMAVAEAGISNRGDNACDTACQRGEQQRQERRDQRHGGQHHHNRTEKDSDRRNDVVLRRQQWCDRQPNRYRGDVRPGNPRTKPPHESIPPRPRFPFEADKRILPSLLPSSLPFGHLIQDQNGEERQQAAGLKQITRVDETDHDPCQRQRVDRTRSPAHQDAETEDHYQDGCPNDRRIGAGEQHVAEGQRRDHASAEPTTESHEPCQRPEHSAQDHQVLTRHDQNMNDAGATKQVADTRFDPRSITQEQSRSERSRLARERLLQDSAGPLPYPRRPDARVPPGSPAMDSNGLSVLDVDLAAPAAVGSPLGRTSFARIVQVGERKQPPDQLDGVSNFDVEHLLTRHQANGSLHRLPAIVSLVILDSHQSDRAVRRLMGSQWIGLGLVVPKLGDCAAQTHQAAISIRQSTDVVARTHCRDMVPRGREEERSKAPKPRRTSQSGTSQW